MTPSAQEHYTPPFPDHSPQPGDCLHREINGTVERFPIVSIRKTSPYLLLVVECPDGTHATTDYQSHDTVHSGKVPCGV